MISRQMVLDVTPAKCFRIPTNEAPKLPIERRRITLPAGLVARWLVMKSLPHDLRRCLASISQGGWGGHSVYTPRNSAFLTLAQLVG